MFRLVGVVAALLCVLSAVPAIAQNNIAPPGWKGFGPSADPNGVTNGNANINASPTGGARDVSTAFGNAGGPVVAYRQNNPDTNAPEIIVKVLNAARDAWQNLGGPVNTTPGEVSEPKARVSATGDIFVAWRQFVNFRFALYLLKWSEVA